MHGIHKATKLDKPRCSVLAAYSNTQCPYCYPSVSCKHSLQPCVRKSLDSIARLKTCHPDWCCVYFSSVIQDKYWWYRVNVGYDNFLACYFLPALPMDALRVMTLWKLGNMRQEITPSYVFTDFWGTKKHIYLQCVMLGSLYRMLVFSLQLGSNYCTGSFTSFSRAKKKKVWVQATVILGRVTS